MQFDGILSEEEGSHLNASVLSRTGARTRYIELIEPVELPTNTLFIGEIVGAYTEERYLTDGKPDIKKINPYTLTMPDNGYWTVGDHAGKAWDIGKSFAPEEQRKPPAGSYKE